MGLLHLVLLHLGCWHCRVGSTKEGATTLRRKLESRRRSLLTHCECGCRSLLCWWMCSEEAALRKPGLKAICGQTRDLEGMRSVRGSTKD